MRTGFDRLIKEIDDLELVACPECLGSKMLKAGCKKCHGDGLSVVVKKKYYTWHDPKFDRRAR